MEKKRKGKCPVIVSLMFVIYICDYFFYCGGRRAGGQRLGEGGGGEGLRDCVYVGVCGCMCVDAGEGEG